MPSRPSSSSSAAKPAEDNARRRVTKSNVPGGAAPANSLARKTTSSSSANNQTNASKKRTRPQSAAPDSAASAASASMTKNTGTRRFAKTSTARSKNSKIAIPRSDAEETSASSMVPAKTSKRAKKETTPLDAANCGICFEEAYEFAGVLDCCQHWYCFECIKKWSDSSNTCPQCKRRIHKIVKTEVKTGKKVKTEKTKKKDLSSSIVPGQGFAGFGPVTLAGANHLHMFLTHGMEAAFEHELSPFLYNMLALYGEDDEFDEDYDEEEDSISSDSHYCPCCTYQWNGEYYGECPNCHCDGRHDDDDDDEDGNSEDDSDSYYDTNRRGSRENPIELE